MAGDAIAAATGRPKEEVFPLLTEQLKRFLFFAEAVRETSDLLYSTQPQFISSCMHSYKVGVLKFRSNLKFA